MPLTAIGNNPTGVNTENLPPTLFGITKNNKHNVTIKLIDVKIKNLIL